MLQPFAYFAPTDLAEASSLLVRHGPHACPLAGGTRLLPALERQQMTATAVVDLRAIPTLADLHFEPARGLEIGALVTLATIGQSAIIRAQYPVLAATVQQMATPTVRHLATVGGNLCSGLAAADLLVVLIALDASVVIMGTEGRRRLALERFVAPWGELELAPGELIVAVQVPPPRGFSAYGRFNVRRAADVPLANVALCLELEREAGPPRAYGIRIAVGASGPAPARAEPAEEWLTGRQLTRENIARAAGLVAANVYPADDRRASRHYRRALLDALTQKSLTKATRDR